MNKIIVAVIIIGQLVVLGCKEKEPQQVQDEKHGNGEQHHAGVQPMSKVVKTDGIQVAFDLMSLDHHQKMMKMMHTTMKFSDDSNHGLMLTILEQGTMKPVKGAEVNITMTEDGSEHPVTKKAMIAEGNGMYHYAADYKIHSRAGCTLSATINANGKTYNVKTTFTMNK